MKGFDFLKNNEVVSEEDKKKKIARIISFCILFAAPLIIYIIGFSLVDSITLFLTIIGVLILGLYSKIKEKLGIQKREKSENVLLLEKKQKLTEEYEKSIEDIDKKILKTHDTVRWVWIFVNFGFIMLFFSFIYFGSLDGKYLDRTVYETQVNNAIQIGNEELKYAIDITTDCFEKIIMNFYNIGIGSFIIFWTYWITAVYWLGYIFIYKILLRGSFYTIKEVVPPVKDFIEVIKRLKILKGGKN